MVLSSRVSRSGNGAKTIFISADHALAIIYFLHSDVVDTILKAGLQVVVLVDDALRNFIVHRFGRPGLTVEGMRLEQAASYARRESAEIQWWLHYLRRVGGSRRINTAAMDSYRRQVAVEESNRRRMLIPLSWVAVSLLRRSATMRRLLVRLQRRFAPEIYADLFERYRPDLVVASTPGWRLDRYLLRESHRRGIPAATAIVGWDNPSSYSLPGAELEWATCWSDLQHTELVLGSDWAAEKVNVGGIPSYDGYFDRRWILPRDEYWKLHGLDPDRKLLSYACSFVSFSPNARNVETLARLVSTDALAAPCQLLVRLHPNHFMNETLFRKERARIRRLGQKLPHVHVVEPVAMAADLSYYSGEDMPEKSSMMAHSDVFLTVYSTMVVETAIHGRPIISLCLDTPGGWPADRKYSLPLSQIGNWPTHDRFRKAGAGRVALTEQELTRAINDYLEQPELDAEQRAAFVKAEVTYTDGSAGRRTGEFLASLA